MDWRGMGPPQQQAAAAVPSLLQMAQGEAPAMSDFRGGGAGGQLEPWANAIASAPPAYNQGTTVGGYNAVFDPQAPSSTGGWFTMNDYLNQAPSPMEAAGWGPQSADGRAGGSNVPSSGGMQSPVRGPRHGGTGGNNFLSTNNWRLLPQGFNTPDYFMINGNIVSRAAARRELSPRSVLGNEGGGQHPGYIPQGTGVWAQPHAPASSAIDQGYIGAGNWGPSQTPTY